MPARGDLEVGDSVREVGGGRSARAGLISPRPVPAGRWMPLVHDPTSIPERVLVDLLESFRTDLKETEELVRNPRGRVLDPASLDTALELLGSAEKFFERPASSDPVELAARINLAYSVLIAVIDLVKSHTDVPRVPRPRAADPSD